MLNFVENTSRVGRGCKVGLIEGSMVVCANKVHWPAF